MCSRANITHHSTSKVGPEAQVSSSGDKAETYRGGYWSSRVEKVASLSTLYRRLWSPRERMLAGHSDSQTAVQVLRPIILQRCKVKTKADFKNRQIS